MSTNRCTPDIRPAGGPALEGVSNGIEVDMAFYFHEVVLDGVLARWPVA
ncbi:hypothetical protein ART_0380 [Arthrobacter sp. PAMC 25486]|nr:hypothetical protein ART_0380 [Arthrobacter sp. PAMC 25486]